MNTVTHTNELRADLVIVGAGMVGSALALALRDSGLDILLIDGDPLADITVLQDKKRILAVMKDGVFHRAPPMREQRRSTTRWAA